MTKRKSTSKRIVYQIKIVLQGSSPPIWRRFQVNSDITLAWLHHCIQVVMAGWDDYHLHEFEIKGRRYGPSCAPDGCDLDTDALDESTFSLSQVAGPGDTIRYTYDFGDNWTHKIKVEKELAATADKTYPVCLTGKRACPPEDCGGLWAYAEFLEAVSDPNHPNHEELLDWIGGDFDPDRFDLEEINEDLTHLR